MLGQLGVGELLIVLIIVLLVFGVGRVSKIGRELGEGIHAFKEGLQGERDTEEKKKKA